MLSRKAIFIFLLINFISANFIYSQCPVPSFDIASNACIGENIYVLNNSSNADSYSWDFCTDDLTQLPEGNTMLNNSDFFRARTVKLIKENANWYGFAVSQTSNNLIKLNFGGALDNIPTFEDLGNPGNRLQGAFDLDAIYINGVWNLVVANTNGGNLINIEFVNGLESDPIISDLGDFGALSNPSHVLALADQDQYFLFVSNTDKLVKLKFDNSLLEPNPVVEVVTVTGSSTLRGLSLIKNCNIWSGILLSYNNRLFSLDFGNSLGNTPSYSQINTSGMGISFPANVALVKEGGLFRGFVQGALGAFHRLDFTGDISDFNFTATQLTIPEFTSNSNFALDLVQEKSKTHVFNFNLDQRNLIRVSFLNDCGSDQPISNDKNPVFSYSAPGFYDITLTAIDQNGNNESITKQIEITNNQAPDITFSTGANLCIANPIEFDSESSSTISSYNWDFGDSNSSTDANPSHTYATAGKYAVKLTVGAANGCNNSFIDSVSVFEEPVPDFQATAQGSICTRKPIVFENLTDLPTEATFSWDLGDGTTSTDEEPEHVYAEAGEYTVIQSINMAGCTVEKTKTITVNPGPLVDFQTVNNCLGEILQFENMSEGDFLDTYQWDFGDGTLSTQANPSHLYDTAGVYTVQLSAFTTNGCDFTISQEVEIQALAEIDFQSEVACVGQPTQFSEQVSITQANITDYFWDFGVLGTQSDVSTEASPQFAYPVSGTYNVTLQVTTSDGCTSSGSQAITVKSSPQAIFESEETCLDQMRLFIPLDTTEIITHFWELQNSEGEIMETSLDSTFSYLFPQAGAYQLTYRQENENLCSQSTTQTFSINEQPSPDFTWGTACAGQTIQLENLTDLKGNTLKSYSWSINEGEEVISSEFNPQYTFEEGGEYLLTLEVETIGGCVQSLSKQISISSAPTAFFELSQTIGAYPFTLNLSAQSQDQSTANPANQPTDNSTTITSLVENKGLLEKEVLWTLNSDTISRSSELNYTIEDPGTYLLGLFITNEAGCTAEYFEQIRVREPSLDISLSNLRINQDGEFTSFLLNISNKGSLVPERIDLAIDLGSYAVTESVMTPLYPEENSNFSLSLKLTEDQIRGLSKICISATPRVGDQADSNIQNNRVCTNLESGFKVMDIYPNPAINQFIIPLITPENGQLTISMEDSNGRQVKVFNYDIEAGYNELRIERESLSPGIYFLRFRYQGQEKVKKIILQ
ncbi:Por secretion system C-terminal sorting domain-containing protein [Marivirga sericea]|uniref:Por secretion system C-terminal sorting domain-containing protein n=1 Tax=Marivirga sericea TaxID=1028 RepID=A0A1X7KME0_9BACT|nr:T9SS type A sorting domain-containing protein [Marivirga sericea]SMG42313.1 Por secretion system C-terminal sorting domain-containing protein [Marivirga sericea]